MQHYRSAIFNPSPYSYGAVDPLTAALETGGKVAELGTAVVGLADTSVQVVAEAKARRFAAPCQLEAAAKNKYMTCKKVNQKKGRPVYPNKPGKWGNLSNDCRDKYKKWQKFKGQCEGAVRDAERQAMLGGSSEALSDTYAAEQNEIVTQELGAEEEEGSNVLLWTGLGVVLLAAVGGGAYVYTQKKKAKK